MKNNPWKGLVSYEEKDLDNYEFCGRTKAVSKYYSLITNSLVSTLYGRTGCGKTSMLQAGIFPLLRQESYFPVMCRLSLRNENTSFADYLIERVEQEIVNLGFSCTESDVPVNQIDDLEKYRLWKYFYGHEFRGKDANIVFPVIVFDQFEEVLINSKDDSLRFLEQISFLVGDDLLLPDDCYANFRVTISLREDFLYLLEDTIDEGKLQGLRDNRMRLTSLSIEEAEEVISLGDDFFADKDRTHIYKEICRLAKNRRGHISTNMLSLICSQIYRIYSDKKGKELVTVDDMKLLSEDPLRDFYKNSIKGLKEETVTFIEKNLVLNGFRKPVTKQEFEEKVPVSDRKKLTSGETKILQFITANDNDCVELMHDTLARAVFGVTKEKKRTSKFWKLFSISLETFFYIIASLTIIFEVIMNNFSASVAIGGVLLVMINWFYSIATIGGKMISKTHFILLWLFNSFIWGAALGTDLLDNVSTLTAFLFFYFFLIPIIYLVKQNYSEVKLGFRNSYKYVFSFEALKEDNGIKDCLKPLSGVLVIGMGLLSGFFMSNWTLWVLLPLSTVLCYYFINQIIGNARLLKGFLHYVYPVVLSLGFVVVQHIATNHVFLTLIVFLLFFIWSVIATTLQKEITLARKITYFISVFMTCTLILPMLYLGYNPLSKEFRNIARNWSQPEINSSVTVPLLAFHNEEGQNGLADRHQIIFETRFADIDSVSYESFDWKKLKDYKDYNLLSRYFDNDDVQNNSDVILYTKTGAFGWKDMFSNRGNSLYLATRIEMLEETPCSNWTEEEFQNIAELAAGYRITGRDSLANSLEVLYFLRRMIQAEIYQNVESKFSTNAETCDNMLDYYLHKRVDPNFEGDYTESFIKNADSCVILEKRINDYLDVADGGFTKDYRTGLRSSYKNDAEYKTFKNTSINDSLKNLAIIDTEYLLNILNSYTINTIPIKWVHEQLGNSVDMLYQTRNTWGSYVVDSIYTAVYEEEFCDDVVYNNSSAWHNLFLCRFEYAEKYARRAIECAKDDYINENTTKYITYTNLITSLFLQGKTEESLDLVRKMKDYSIGVNEGDWTQLLFPIQAERQVVSVGEGVCQDFNHFIRIGVLKDSTTTDFRELRNRLSLEYSLVSDQGHFVYSNGWNLSSSNSQYLFYKNEEVRLPLISSYDINVKDSVAICHMVAGGYRFLDLSNMYFIGDTYDYAWHFNEGIAAVEEDGKIGFINKQGEIEIAIQYSTEDWLRQDHYRLSFYNGKAAITNSSKYYNLIDREGNWIEDYSCPYVKWYGMGMVVKLSQKKNWVYTDAVGNIQGEFDREIDDILIHPYSGFNVPIFHHFDISDFKYAEELPELDISGVWYCFEEESIFYFGKNNSQYMCLGKKYDLGNYYLSVDDDEIHLHLCSDKTITRYINEIDSGNMSLDGHRLVKIRSL